MVCCYMSHICPHASVSQKWWPNVSWNLFLWILVPLEGGRGKFMCGRHGAGLDWPEEKDNIVAAISYLFLLQKRFDQSYATNLLWNIFPNFLPNFWLEGGIWEEHYAPNCPKIWVLGACIWLARRFLPSYACLFFLQQRFVQSYAANLLGTSSSTFCQIWALDEAFECIRYEATVYF